ncbi:MAG: flotillin family protein [Myxococcales bacterium]|nr:flotillin family protein [Myxococcales bacterium]
MSLYAVLVTVGAIVILVLGMAGLLMKFYRKVDQGKALIVNNLKADPDVVFTGAVVYPIIHRAEIMDISVKTIEIDRRGKEGLICKDNIRADIKVTFFVRVNKTREDVLKVAQSIGCVRASDHKTLEDLFAAKFSEALKTVGKRMEFESLYEERDRFRDEIIDIIGRDLNGYILEDAAIDYLEQTPLANLDSNNILDAQGIRKITELTSIQHVRTNEYANNEKKLIKKQDVEATEAILELERQQADAESKQKREIATVRAREDAEVLRVQAEERLKAESARIKTTEDLSVQEENKNRQVEVAKKNRERVVAVEGERVERDRVIEQIGRERETELLRIAKEKALEVERKAIQDVIRERIAVEKTVAEEEERIKDLRLIAEAKRNKEAVVLAAEAEAQELLVKGIKAAEAAEQASKYKAKERLVLADADLEATDKAAKAKIRLAEGIQAEEAAAGLARVRVKEADAIALEKVGFAEARVLIEKAQAEAQGNEASGLARARVLEAEAAANEKAGLASARVRREQGTAEAQAILEKANSMRALDEATRGHEEFRLRVEMEKSLGLEEIHAKRQVAEAQARILGDAFKTAKIDIVGGDAAFIDRVVNAVSYGKSLDGAVKHSNTLSTLGADYLNGKSRLLDDVKKLIATSGLSATDLQALTVTAFLTKMMRNADGGAKTHLQNLLAKATELGLADTNLS